MSAAEGPPRPRLVLRIGVAGHKRAALPKDADRALGEAVTAALRLVMQSINDLHAENGEVFAPTSPLLRIVSALADGADTILARAGQSVGAALDVPLPFPREVYRQDFKTPEDLAAFDDLLSAADAVFELDGMREAADRAYEAAGAMILQQSDLLVAIWDGQGSHGRGGTHEVVRSALAAGVPILWFAPAGGAPRLLKADRDTNTVHPSDLVEGAPLADHALLEALIYAMLAPPPRSSAPPGASKEALAAAWRSGRLNLMMFLSEQERAARSVPAYRLLLFLMQAGGLRSDRRSYEDRAHDRWRAYLEQTHTFSDQLPRHCTNRLRTAFQWADGLAGRYGDLHRNGAVKNFGLAAVAVGISLVSIFDHSHEVKPYLVTAEIAVLLYIVWTTLHGARRRWHERWVDYRELSERFRLMRVMAMVGAAGSSLKHGRADASTAGSASWTLWYANAIGREVGLPNARVTDRYLMVVLNALGECELKDQIAYHHGNAQAMGKVEGRLELFGHLLLGGVALVGAYYLTLDVLAPAAAAHWGRPMGHFSGWMLDLVTFLAGLLPAVGAACLGIRAHGEFRRRRDLSILMEEGLERLQARLQRVAAAPRLAGVAALVEDSCEAMLAEVGDWSFILRSQPLSLPG